MSAVNPAHQLVILTRLGEFCRYHASIARHHSDPWEYMRRKLLDTESAIEGLKDDLFQATSRQLLEELAAGPLDPERCADFKTLFEGLLAAGDFADLAIHIDPVQPSLEAARLVLAHVRAHHLFIEERKPDGQRSPSWDRLVDELYRRLDLDRLGEILGRKPRTAKRKAVVLRRVRRNVAEYCSVMHIPTDARDTFTPFMLPRIEGLIAANLRFLRRYR